MANNWYFAYNNAPLSEALQTKLQRHGVLQDIPDVKIAGNTEIQFVKDFFTSDGFPHLGNGVNCAETAYPYIFPVIAPWYDGAAIPAATVEMDPLYRQTACDAAMSWLENLTSAADPAGTQNNVRTFHGLAFQEVIDGTTHTFAFPDTRIRTSSHGTAAVVLIADSYWNNAEWEKQGSVPLYARQQALFQLWCWLKFAEKCNYQVEAPETAFIVRICGNLAVDCTIRTVRFNMKEAQALVNRVCKARNQEPQRGLYWKRNIEAYQTWSEKLNNEAFRTEDSDLYSLVVAYMKARSDRKQIDRELSEVADRMDAIAIELASYIPSGSIQGTYDLPDGTICTVTHQKKRSREKKITPDLVRSFFPALDDCICVSGLQRTTVTIEAL